MNQVMLVGRLVRPVEVKTVGDHRVVNNTLAVTRRNRDKQGEILADFIPISAWGHLADVLSNYCDKGQQVGITGRMHSRSYTNSMQQTVYVVECLVTEITLLDGSRKQHYDNDYQSVAEAYDVPLECPID
ncbi:MAG: single-stranded DNA-binding protein [Aerococcaceae bacterium]|nr:single-stranded DNA-binding protein [Aerococcaceae bacterium]